MKVPDSYLGDGVYASFDGFNIWLDLRGQDDTTKIALEPQVLEALDGFRAAVRKTIKAELDLPPREDPGDDAGGGADEAE